MIHPLILARVPQDWSITKEYYTDNINDFWTNFLNWDSINFAYADFVALAILFNMSIILHMVDW